MKLTRLLHNGEPTLAIPLDEEHLACLTPRFPHLGDDPLPLLTGAAQLPAEVGSWHLPEARTALAGQGLLVRSQDAKFLPPVRQVGKLVCLALNYRAHAAEGGFTPPTKPSVFFKAPSSVIAHQETVNCPPFSKRLDYEIELAVLIGRRARGLTQADWRSAVAGYTVMNDMTARDMQLDALALSQPWDLSKSFDTFGPMGPCIVSADEIPDPQALTVELRVNGEVRQHGSTSQMIFSVPYLLEYISAYVTLEPGDIILTGTPDGIGPVEEGSTIEATIERIGTLRNTAHYLA